MQSMKMTAPLMALLIGSGTLMMAPQTLANTAACKAVIAGSPAGLTEAITRASADIDLSRFTQANDFTNYLEVGEGEMERLAKSMNYDLIMKNEIFARLRDKISASPGHAITITASGMKVLAEVVTGNIRLTWKITDTTKYPSAFQHQGQFAFFDPTQTARITKPTRTYDKALAYDDLLSGFYSDKNPEAFEIVLREVFKGSSDLEITGLSGSYSEMQRAISLAAATKLADTLPLETLASRLQKIARKIAAKPQNGSPANSRSWNDGDNRITVITPESAGNGILVLEEKTDTVKLKIAVDVKSKRVEIKGEYAKGLFPPKESKFTLRIENGKASSQDPAFSAGARRVRHEIASLLAEFNLWR